jgi:Flp pilus assembly protein TadD
MHSRQAGLYGKFLSRVKGNGDLPMSGGTRSGNSEMSMNESDKVHDLDYLYKAGAEAAAEGETEKALHFIERVLRMDPNHAKAWNIKGNCLDRMGKCEDALFSYDTAIQLDPADADVLFNKAETLEKMGREADAKVLMDQAVQLEMGE